MEKIPTTIPCEGRFDIKSLATVIRFYYNNGYILKTRSTILNQVIQDFASSVVNNGMASPFTSTIDALEYIKSTVGFSARTSKAVQNLSINITHTDTKQKYSDKEIAEAIREATMELNK